MGEGTARGIEFLVQKTAGKTTGWFAYTLAKSDRIFPDGSINNGERFPYKYDRRHSIDISVDHRFNKTWGIDGAWSFATGGYPSQPQAQSRSQLPQGAAPRGNRVESQCV